MKRRISYLIDARRIGVARVATSHGRMRFRPSCFRNLRRPRSARAAARDRKILVAGVGFREAFVRYMHSSPASPARGCAICRLLQPIARKDHQMFQSCAN